MIAPVTPENVPPDKLKEAIMNGDFPQFHHDESGTVPRVSSILKLHRESLFQKLNFGRPSRAFVRNVEITAVEGNIVHNRIHRLLAKKDAPVVPPKRTLHKDPMEKSVEKKIRKFHAWLAQQQPEILVEPDNRIVSAASGYGGTPDLVARIKGKNVVTDYKIGGMIHIPNWLQVEAYAHLIERERDIKVHQIAVLLLGSNAKAGYFRVHDRRQSNMDEFSRLLDLWHEMFPEPFGEIQSEDHLVV